MKLLENIVIKEKNILLRVDLNIPTKNGLIIDKTRIDVLKPTINYLRKTIIKFFYYRILEDLAENLIANFH